MKIECIYNRVDPAIHSKRILDWAYTTGHEGDIELTLGEIYTVLAISKYNDIVHYYIMVDSNYSFPLAYPTVFFKIVDSRVSSYWDSDLRSIISIDDLNIKNHEVCSFTQWTNQKDLFYENILEEDKQTMLIFNEFKDKMMAE